MIESMNLDEVNCKKIVSFFSEKPVLKAYLFGSYGRGEGREHSDIDLLVELDHSQPIGWDFIQMQLDLQELLEKKVDLVSARGLSRYIRPIIEKEKVLIYAQ